jgi:hypothetical protein
MTAAVDDGTYTIRVSPAVFDELAGKLHSGADAAERFPFGILFRDVLIRRDCVPQLSSRAVPAPLSRVLLDLATLAEKVVAKPYVAFGFRPQIEAVAAEVHVAIARPAESGRLIGEEARVLVMALDALARGDRRAPWDAIALLIIPPVKANAYAAFEAEQHPTP